MSTSYIPSASIENLRCDLCKRYLSHFPIKLTTYGLSVCGRCPSTEGRIIKFYETLARHIQFPCINDTDGCKEFLTPADVPKHEKYCPYKKYDCPRKTTEEECEWQGFASSLAEHFQTDHSEFFFKTDIFQADLIETGNENYLVSYDENLFIVTVSHDFELDTLSFSLNYLGSNPSMEDSFYKLKLQIGTKDHWYVMKNKIGETSIMESGFLNNELDEPTNIRVKVNILSKSSDKKDVQQLDNEIKMKKQLLSQLECPVCLEYLTPPIIQCLNGHSICRGCKPEQNLCPLCRCEIHNTRNYILEQTFTLITYPCKNSKCSFTALIRDLKEHEESCKFGYYDCPVREYDVDCLWSGPPTEIYNHVAAEHGDSYVISNEQNLVYLRMPQKDCESKPLIQDFENCFILRELQNTFILHMKYRKSLQKFYWSVQLMGPAHFCKDYKFDIDIIDKSGNKMRRYMKSMCTQYKCKNWSFLKINDFVTMDLGQVAPLITDELLFAVSVYQE